MVESFRVKILSQSATAPWYCNACPFVLNPRQVNYLKISQEIGNCFEKNIAYNVCFIKRIWTLIIEIIHRQSFANASNIDALQDQSVRYQLWWIFLHLPTLIYFFQLWFTSSIFDLLLKTLIYFFQLWFNSSNFDLLLPTLIYFFQLWFTSSNFDLLFPTLIYFFQLWFTSSNFDLFLPTLIYFFQLWFTS